MQDLEYTLEGLNCADCAVRIQEDINEMDGVNSAEVVFATQKLNIIISNPEQLEQIEKEIEKKVVAIEPGVKVVKTAKHLESTQSSEYAPIISKYLLVLVPAILLFAAGLILPLPAWLQICLFGLSYLLAGWDVVLHALKNVIRGKFFDENFLMSIATIGAFLVKEYPEAAAVMLFFKFGEMLEDIAVSQSRKSIKALVDIRPDYANIKTPEGLLVVNPDSVSPGDVIVVKPGEKVPLDGLVTEGSSFVDTSALTGESVPRAVGEGDDILSGSVNGSGLITIKVTKSFSQSTVSKILELVQNAASKKAPVESFITKFARYYTPAVVAASALTAVVPPVVTGSFDFSTWTYRALIFLVISCPCALVVSIPLSFFGGIGAASRRGILIKGGNYLEALNNVGTIVFDKTGTLTKGRFKVDGVISMNGFTKEEVLEFAALAESQSSHPIAKSLLEAYGAQARGEDAPVKGSSNSMNTRIDRIESYEEISGHGVRAVIDGREILAGSDRLIHIVDGIKHDTCRIGGTVVHVAVDRKYAGYILVADEMKEDAAAAVTALKQRGISKIVMLSGDSRHTVEETGKRLGLDEVYSDLLPHQKVEQLELLKGRIIQGIKGKHGKKDKLLFVGDGINDAPVLARADIGVAMGAFGSDAAIEASDIVLMTDEPSKLVKAFEIARKTRKIVWQNIAFALGVKLIVMVLGAGGIATMWEAVFADVGVTLIAVFNSLRLVRSRLEPSSPPSSF